MEQTKGQQDDALHARTRRRALSESPQAVAAKQALHAGFVKQFRDGAQVLTSKSGHHIQLEEPELVIVAIHKVIAQVRRS